MKTNYKKDKKETPLVIVLRGAPGSGKTTTSELLKKFIPKTVVISGDTLTAMVVPDKNHWREFWPLGHEAARILLEFFLKKKFNVVVEEILPDVLHIERIIAVAKNFQARVFVFQLEASLAILNLRKKYLKPQMSRNLIKELYGMVLRNPYPGAIKIDTTKLSPQECVDFILGSIDGRRF